LIDVELTDGANSRKERRQDRKTVITQNMAQPMPSAVTPTTKSEIQIPTLNRPVLCPTCTSKFEASMELKMVKCPICDSRIDL
jgi:Zn finger protein HypA/HybF involved in hydrogenase expression